MNEKLRMVLVLACATVAAFYTYRFLAQMRETTTVVLATREISGGTKIDASMLAEVEVGIKERQLLTPYAIQEAKQVVGYVPKRTIKKGAVLSLDPDDFFLTPDALREVSGAHVPPAYLIEAGKVAIAIPVDADSSVGYSLRKGDLVNVIYTGKVGDELNSITILAEVEVFATGKAETAGGLGGSGQTAALRTVTLLVSPTDAERLVLAKRTGKLDLALIGK